MRIRLATRPGVLFGAMVVLAALALLPLRLVLGMALPGDQGLAARAVHGSVWAGLLEQAQIGDVALGDLDAHLAPLPLLIGQAHLVLTSRDQGAAPAIRATLVVDRHLAGVDHLDATLAPGALFAPLPVTQIAFDAASIRFRDGACERAEGRVRATLAGQVAGVALPAALSGTLRCDGAVLVMPMTSPAGDGVTLRVGGDGQYVADVLLHPADPATAARLAAGGFTPGGGGYRLSVTGRFGQS